MLNLRSAMNTIRTHSSIPPFGIREEDIQKCAYCLWKEENCPTGRDLDFWLAAKELVRHQTPVSGRHWAHSQLVRSDGQ